MSYVEEFCDNIAIINQGEVVLEGELKEIKKDYSKNRLMLSAENYSLDELAEKVEKDLKGVLVAEKKKEFLVLELTDAVSKKEVVKALAETDIDIVKFGRYEPSLNDIFVGKVGEELEK